MKTIHGHEVLQMMLDDAGKTYTSESLASEIIARFGADARFYTCSAQNMTAAELVEFLRAKGKFVPRQTGGFQTSPDLMCKH